jgi:type I site-specific restriction-modification system R (restriction) subunit
MALIIDENGKVTSRVDTSLDNLKRAPYKHTIKEEEDSDVESFVDSLEEVEDVEDVEDAEDTPEEDDIDPEDAVELAIQYTQFRAAFAQIFGEQEQLEAFSQLEDFFSQSGVDINIDLEGLEEEEGEEEEPEQLELDFEGPEEEESSIEKE